ncbi:hypothetical protein C8Q79DRAFT_925005 [Trametes meyenii]|nr:hypothetical protein C8Q79DRAFT_925005 [Trametes meyenii]
MPEPIVFYDIPGKNENSKAWSPNTWKTRYSLNYKCLPYKTVWVEYLDIATVLRKIGALPTMKNPDGSPLYTLPAIYDPNTKTALAESFAIARYLDKTYPDTPRLIPEGTDALHVAFTHAFRAVLYDDLMPITIPASADYLRPRSEAYFRSTREVAFGGDLRQLAPAGSEKRAERWKGIKKAFATYAQWIAADGTGKLYFLGEKPGYADFTLAAFFTWIRVVLGEDNVEWKDVLTDNGDPEWPDRWGKYFESLAKYKNVDAGEEATL